MAAIGTWEMVDETYAMKGTAEGCRVLLATEHPRNLSTLAWTRVQGRARVFCYQSGHGRQAYDDPNYRTVLGRGVHWAAGRL